MSRLRSAMVAALAALALTGIATSVASASWFVGGSELKTSAAVVSLLHIASSAVLHLPNANVHILCTGPIHLVNAIVIPPDLIIAARIIYLNCHIIQPTPTKCQLVGGNATIETTSISGKATLKRLTLKPATGKTFAEIPFEEGTACVLEGKQPVKGEVVAGMPVGEKEETAQEILGLGSEENNSLEVGTGNKATLLGRASLLLGTGSKWSFK